MSDNLVWKIEITGSDIDKPIVATFEKKLVLGRYDETGKTSVDVDFSPYGAASKGVSRQHARLVSHQGKLVLQELKASNGTALNGDKLNTKQTYNLNLDEENTLSLGALKLRLRVVSKPDATEDDAVDTAPLPADDDATESKRPNAETTDQPAPSVLIIDDSATNADLFAMCAQTMGYRSYIARDAKRALRYLETETPIAVIVDYMLPGMDGPEITRFIRREKNTASVAIVMVSANHNAGTRRAALESGADEFLAKPVNTDDLVRVLTQCIEERQTGDGPLRTRELGADTDGTKTLPETDILSQDVGISDETVAVLISGAVERPFTVTVKKPISFGRGKYANPATHVDLSRYGASEKGVSRVHMRLSHRDGAFYIEDLDSVNGTYINSVRVRVGEKLAIESGTEIRLGQLGMYIYFGKANRPVDGAGTRELTDSEKLSSANGR